MVTVFVHCLMDALFVGRVECVALACQDELLLVLDLVRIFVAHGSCDSHTLVVKVKDKIVLSHHGATEDHLAAVLNIDGYAVAASLLTVEVLRGVPVHLIVLVFGTKLEPKDWEGAEVVVGALWELFLVVAEAQVALSAEINLPLAVVLWVERAEPIEM